jgi:hypothetical protein
MWQKNDYCASLNQNTMTEENIERENHAYPQRSSKKTHGKKMISVPTRTKI